MVKSTIKGVRIEGIASAVPTTWLSLMDQFADSMDEKTIRKFSKNTGVSGRYLAGPKQTSSDLCFAAANKIIETKRINKEKIGVLVLVTQTADYRSPASAMTIHYRLGLSKSCIAFDINLGCSGYTSGLNVVGSLLMQSDLEYGLLLCGDTSAREKNPYETTFSSNADRMLFGDSGTATLLHKGEIDSTIHIASATDGSRFKSILVPYEWYRNPQKGSIALAMDGVEVFNFSTSEAPKMIKGLMATLGTTPDDYDYLVLHQANKLIMDRIVQSTRFDKKKSIQSIKQFGNTSSGSIPNTLVYHFGEEEAGNIHCIMCGYGTGLSWSAVDCYIDKKDILQLTQTDEFYEDGF